MPERFLLQILRSMVTHGILQSTRGVEGGYSLARPASSVTLLDIVESVEGPVAGAPIEGADDAVREALSVALTKVCECVAEELSKVKLTDLLKPVKNGSP
jgi:Rrf2 family protein